jgi:hypothetical protein
MLSIDLLSAATGPATPNRGNPALMLLAVALGVIMVGIDGTIVAVANRAIQSHLHASLAGMQWVSVRCLPAGVCYVCPCGRPSSDSQQAGRMSLRVSAGVGGPANEKGTPVMSEDAAHAGGPDDGPASKNDRPAFDTSVAHQARIYNYWLGGCFL